MFNGSENYPATIFDLLQQVGATDQNGTTWFDRTNYFQTVPTAALEWRCSWKATGWDICSARSTRRRLDNQRGVVQNEKRQGDNEPYGLVEYSMLEGLFPAGHPYRWSTIGSMDDLERRQPRGRKGWFRHNYGPNNAVLVLAGDIDVATARPLVEQYFGDIDPGPPVARREAAVPIRAANTRDVLRDRVPQARIYRYWTTPGRTTRESLLLGLAADVLGSGKSSRLYEALVVQQKIATEVSARSRSTSSRASFRSR